MHVSDPVAGEFREPKRASAVIGLAFSLYRRYPLLFLVLALGVIAPYDLIVLAITHGDSSDGRVSGNTGFILSMIEWTIIAPLISALHVHAVADIRDGREPQLSKVAWRGLIVLPVVTAATIASGLAIFVGFLFLIVPGVFLWLRWFVVAQATATAEEGGWFEGLGRSWELTKGNGPHVFAFVGLSILVLVVPTIVGVAISASGDGAPQFIANLAIHTLTASFVALTTACLFYDLVVREHPAATPTRTYTGTGMARIGPMDPPGPDEEAINFQIERALDEAGSAWQDMGTSRGAEPNAAEQALMTGVTEAGVYRIRRADGQADRWEYYFVVPETGHLHRRAPL